MPEFKVYSDFEPMGDQPQAIETIARGIMDGKRSQTLMGVTGSGKTFTMAKIIEKVQKPTLVISHNKTLAAQLHGEFREFFPEIIPVHDAELLYGIGRCSVLPVRTYFLSFRTGSVLDYVSAHRNKNLIRLADLSPPIYISPRSCYTLTYESTENDPETIFVFACDRHDVRDLFFLSPDRGGVRAIKLRDQLSDRRDQKRNPEHP